LRGVVPVNAKGPFRVRPIQFGVTQKGPGLREAYAFVKTIIR